MEWIDPIEPSSPKGEGGSTITSIIFFPTRSDLAIMYGWDALNSKTAQEVLESVKDRILEK